MRFREERVAHTIPPNTEMEVPMSAEPMSDEELLKKRVEMADFVPHQNRSFRVRLQSELSVSLTLDAVQALPENKTSRANIRKSPFSLMFSGAAEMPLANALHHLTTDGGECFILYLDKKEHDAETRRIIYESVVN